MRRPGGESLQKLLSVSLGHLRSHVHLLPEKTRRGCEAQCTSESSWFVPSSAPSLFVSVFVCLIGQGYVVPLLPPIHLYAWNLIPNQRIKIPKGNGPISTKLLICQVFILKNEQARVLVCTCFYAFAWLQPNLTFTCVTCPSSIIALVSLSPLPASLHQVQIIYSLSIWIHITAKPLTITCIMLSICV